MPESTPLPEALPKEETGLLPLKEPESRNRMKIASLGFSAVLIVAAGILTGSWLAGQKTEIGITGGKHKVIKSEKVVGSTDTKTFRDSTEGMLEKDGLDGEGTHHLVREGGPSQTAYLTSSVIDLDEYVGKKVKVFGETFAAQKAGWLMDVGKIELLE